MTPLAKELAEIYRQMLVQNQKALDLGNSLIHLEAEAITDVLDQRDRILQLLRQLKEQAKPLDLKWRPIATPAEIAFIAEQEARLKDLKPKFAEQNRRVSAALKTKLANVRGEMAQQTRSVNALRKYLSAAGSKPVV